MSDEIEERLGLPLVESIRENTGDTCFAGLYEEFVGGLQPCRSIITAKYEFFMLQDEKISAVAAARLLGCVLNLDDVLTRALIGSLFNIMKLPVLGEDSKERNISVEFDNFTLDKLWVYLEDPEFRKDFFHYCWHGPSFEDQDVMLSQIRHFVAAPSMLEYQSFSEGRAKPVIDIEFNYLQDYSAERFRVVVMNDDWSAVLCSPLEVHVIPAFLGFIRRNDYALNLADLGRTVGNVSFLGGGTIEWIKGLDNNDRILVEDLTRNEEWGVLWPFIIPLTKKERDQLLKDMDTFGEIEGVIAEIHEIAYEGKHALYTLDDDGSVQPLYEAKGRPTNKMWFENIRDELEQEREAEYERTSPKNIPIGPELIERLNRWVDEKTASRDVEQIRFLAVAIEGRGKALIEYLRSQNTIKARRVLNQINKMAEEGFSGGGAQAIVWNAPLRTVKREVFGEGD